jgi:hypothetical protein
VAGHAGPRCARSGISVKPHRSGALGMLKSRGPERSGRLVRPTCLPGLKTDISVPWTGKNGRRSERLMVVAGCRMKSNEARQLTCGQWPSGVAAAMHETHIIAGLTPHSWSGCGTLSPLLRATQRGDDALLCACSCPRPRSGLANCTKYITIAALERRSPRSRLYYIESSALGAHS